MNTTISPETQEISLRLEHYDDIFSDFDMRPYSKRALSVDFLDEIKRATRDKNEGGIELALHVMEKDRSESHEATIRERLVAHFKKHQQMLAEEKRGVMNLGIGMVALGVICMIGATFLVFNDRENDLFRSFLIVFLEPAAWFLLWEGMDQIVFNSKNIQPELDFYKKMANSEGHIHFRSY